MKLEDQEWVINPNTGNKINMKKLLTEQRLAMVFIDTHFPFFSSLLKNLTWIYTFQVPTQATDGTRILVNPEFTSKLSIQMKAFVMMHEVMHCALDHMARSKHHDPRRSNIAADYEVNGLLIANGVLKKSDIKDFLYDDKYVNRAYEIIYADNPSGPSAPPIQQGGQQGSGGQDGQQGSGGQDGQQGSGGQDGQQGSGGQDGQQGSGGQGTNEPTGVTPVSGKEKGKGNDGNSQASEKSRKEAAESGVSQGGIISQQVGAEIAKSEGYDESDCKEENLTKIQQDWKDATIEACSKNNGSGMGTFIAKMQEYYMTSHDWKSDLRKYIGHALSKYDTESKLGKKKWLANDRLVKYDKQASNDLSSVIFLIDCSGSVSDKLLQNLISECYTIVKKKKIQEVTYCYYDDGIRQIDTNRTAKFDGKLNNVIINKLKKNRPSGDVHGRGGNVEGKVMADLQKLLKDGREKVELVMWFSDGYAYTALPKRPKNIKNMIWVIYDNTSFTAPDNSKVIHIKSEDLGK